MNSILLVSLLLLAAAVQAAPVKVVCLDFIGEAPVTNAEFLWMENGTSFLSNNDGEFFFDAAVGSEITLNFTGNEKYHAIQSVTVTVPPEGLTTVLTQIVMQMPSKLLFDVFMVVVPGSKTRNMSACQVVVTVCNVNKTVYDVPQGLLNTSVFLTPALQTMTYFFGTWGSLSNETNPFPNDLNTSSWDGGVLFENVPVDPNLWYTVTAFHEGYTFSTTRFRCASEGLFINGAPNQGPRATPVPGYWKSEEERLRAQKH